MRIRSASYSSLLLLMGVAVLALLHGCGKSEESDVPTAYLEDFSGNVSSIWKEYEMKGSVYGDSQGWIEDESYHIRVDSSPYFSLQDDHGSGCSDFVLEADVTRIHGPYDGAFGLVFRYNDETGFYAAVVHSEGYMQWLISDGNTLTALSEWEPCTAYHENNEANRLAVVVQGPRFRSYVNGILQSEIVDYTHESGSPGLFVVTAPSSSTPLHVAFDNIRLEPNSEFLTEIGGRFPLEPSKPGTTCAIDLADKWPASFAGLYSTQLCVYGIGLGDSEGDIETASKRYSFNKVQIEESGEWFYSCGRVNYVFGLDSRVARINIGCSLGESGLVPPGFQHLVNDWRRDELDQYFGGRGQYVDTGSALGVPGVWGATYPRGFELSKGDIAGYELEFMLVLKDPSM